MNQISLFLIGFLLVFIAQCDSKQAKIQHGFSMKIDHDSTINLSIHNNKEIYDYLTTKIGVGKIKQGYYSREKILVTCEYSKQGRLDSILIKTISGQGIYNDKIEKSFINIQQIRFIGQQKRDSEFRIQYLINIWEETGEFQISGLLLY